MDESKIILEVANIPRVDLNFMNNTHFEEIEMVKEIGDCISAYQQDKNDDNAEKITMLLINWIKHTEAHFARENELMQETQFPAYPVHAQEHEAAFHQMKTLTKTWQENKEIDPIADYVFSYWPEWFNAHVNSMDMMTAKFAIMNGYTEPAIPT